MIALCVNPTAIQWW